MEASRWLQRCANHFNKDRLTANREWLLRNILGAMLDNLCQQALAVMLQIDALQTGLAAVSTILLNKASFTAWLVL